jgi:hypothetical protein
MLSKQEGAVLAKYTNVINEMTADELDGLAVELKWISFGLDGQGPAKINSLKDLETSHLENILVMCSHALTPVYAKTILHILKARKVL